MGDEIVISAVGDGADAAVGSLADLVEAKFHESE
jgi:phosphotransferase system HPr-like phosphotransfer protein